ncbi:uncharacterized protein C10orf67 homolog, mitochondrial [Vombatus ursinus]|uniref:uncharacterized protein C10orf67 homolog, mitochondrial n=1 Tax=Vombatus ursinus TaxID=29139 RepID=UPI000FFD68E9|nr:uncharacterized protein C10orf67 homolog, mitochondrial [Vombatus ursinus]
MAESERAEPLGAQMDEPKSAELPQVETWDPLPSVERWKKFHVQPTEEQLEYFDFDPRVTLSDDLKIGYFKTDRATQTDVTEVLEIRKLSDTTQKLVKVTTLLQRDFKYLKIYLEMQFEDRLKEVSNKLHKEIQMIIEEIVALHEKNEDTMRKSFYKQLCDAIASIRGAYSHFFEVEEEAAKMPSVNTNIFKRKLMEKNDIIRDLQEQLASYKENKFFKLESLKEEYNEKIAQLGKEISDLRRENDKLNKATAGLEEDLQLCEKANTLLEGELSAMKQRVENDQKTIQKLTLLKDKLCDELDQEKRAIQDMYGQQKEAIEETRRLLEAEGIGAKSFRGTPKSHHEERPSLRRTPSVSQEGRNWDQRLSRSGRKESFMKEGTPAAAAGAAAAAAAGAAAAAAAAAVATEAVAAKAEHEREENHDLIWREGVDSKQSMEFQIRKLKKILEMQRRQLRSLETEAGQDSKIWEKKYLILKNTLHALKDEMFTRQSFVRQFVTLSDAYFNYHKAKPLYIQPKRVPSVKERPYQPTVLPRLDSSSHSQISDDFLIFSMPTTSRGMTARLCVFLSPIALAVVTTLTPTGAQRLRFFVAFSTLLDFTGITQTPNAPLTIHETGKIPSLPGQNRRQQDPVWERSVSLCLVHRGGVFTLKTKPAVPVILSPLGSAHCAWLLATFYTCKIYRFPRLFKLPPLFLFHTPPPPPAF